MSYITNKLEDAKSALNEFSRKRRFKKANAARAEAAELQNSLAVCRGKLEICKKDFNRTIRTEARNIAEGNSIGADTSIQEQTLWDAAIGYMMVKDAIFALKTISTFDSVSHAYDMLTTAVELMTERQRILPKLKLNSKKDRNVYGYLTSNTALQQKQGLLDGFFEDLKRTGDIEACLATAKSPEELAAIRKTGQAADPETARWDSVLGARNDAQEDIDLGSIDTMPDIHRPDSE